MINKKAIHLAVFKARSRGPAEQRAMFAKMGSAGSLQGKGPDGKRTGPKEPPMTPTRRLNLAHMAARERMLNGIKKAREEKDLGKRLRILEGVRDRADREFKRATDRSKREGLMVANLRPNNLPVLRAIDFVKKKIQAQN